MIVIKKTTQISNSASCNSIESISFFTLYIIMHILRLNYRL